MKTIFLVMAAFPLMGMAQPGGKVFSIGGSAAKSCYQSAKTNDTSRMALTTCNAAIGQESSNRDNLVATHVNRGILHMMREDFGQAEGDFNQAIALDPKQPDAWLNFAIAHYQQGKMTTASTMFERAITLRTQSPALAYYGRALVKEDGGDLKGAYADLRRAAELSPKWDAPNKELERYRVVR